MLVGRMLECARIESLLEGARMGSSEALVIRGEPGVGKTALLGYAADLAQGMRILRARGYEGEQRLPYAGLSLLMLPLEGLLDDIPAPQRRALAAALRLGPPGAIDRFAAYAGTMSVLAAAAETGPLLVVVDDFHWLDVDSSHALVFAARRLRDEGIAVVLATRTTRGFGGVPELALSGLGVRAAGELLAAETGQPVPEAVARRLHEATAGNPLALVELSRALSPGQLAGSEPIDDPLPGSADLDAVFGRRIDALPANTRRALAAAAADDRASVELLGLALERLGLSLDALGRAEAAGMVSLELGSVEFGHPLVRAAAYRRACAPERRAAHAAFADALGEMRERDRRAWHLARAALGPDEAVAAELEAVADEARARGAPRAAAHALEEAARVTPAGRRRIERLLRAARDHQDGGAPVAANHRLDEALAAVGDDAVLRARVQHARVHGQFLSAPPRPMQELLRTEAERVRPVDEAQAVAMLIDAAYLYAPAGDASGALCAAREVAPLARRLAGDTEAAANWMLACAEILTGNRGEGVRWLEQSLPALRERPLAAPWIATAAGACLLWLEQQERARSFLAEIVDAARREGKVLVLPYALAHLAQAEYRLGRWTSAYALASESVTLAEDMEQRAELSHSLMRLAEIDAGRGREKSCRLHAERSLALADEFELGSMPGLTGYALGLLELGLGRLEATVERLEPVRRLVLDAGLEEPSVVPWAQDLAEAYVRLGKHADADRVLGILERQAKRTRGALASAAARRCRGLAAPDDGFEPHFRRALVLHERCPAPFEQARTRLCFGERLRRARKRTEARDQLRAALETFVALGAQPWADRALRELRATGERARRRAPETADELTAQELQVAMLTAEGATNKEAAAALFISPRTVETHLNHVYRKLGVRSRVELARRLGGQARKRSTTQADAR